LPIELASKLYGINVSKLEKYEEYRDIPSSEEIISILKLHHMNYDEIAFIIYDDISKHYRG